MNKKPARLLLAACVALATIAVNAGEADQRCRGPGGQFIKCPVMTPMHCRDKTSKKFVQCSAANSEPIPKPAEAPAAPTGKK